MLAMSFVRFLMLLALVVWVGGIVFFAFVVAPNLFIMLPTRQLAGQVVSRALGELHWMGIAAGLIFLLCSLVERARATGSLRAVSPRNLLMVGMLALTLTSQFAVGRKMLALRAEMGVIDNVAQNDPRRVEFNQLHQWSTRLEGGTLLLGLLTLWVLSRQWSSPR